MTSFSRIARFALLPILTLVALPDEVTASHLDRPLSIGIAAGLVDNGNDEETYVTANFRFPIKRTNQGKGVFRLFLEPEVGFWDFADPFGSDDLLEGEVLNVGINFLAVAQGRRFDVWVGAGVGAYIEDVQIIGGGVGTVLDESETSLGGNLQVGVDINIGSSFAIFGVGRIDFVDTDFFDEQQKLLIGIRFRFGR